MIMLNGKTSLGWRMDEVNEDSPAGIGMLLNPFAILPSKENAERVEVAFRLLGELKAIAIRDDVSLAAWAQGHQAEIDKVVGKS